MGRQNKNGKNDKPTKVLIILAESAKLIHYSIRIIKDLM